MSAVYSRRLFGPVEVATPNAVLVYTTPALRTAIFRSIILCNRSLTVVAHVELRAVTNAVTSMLFTADIPAWSTVAVPDDVILNPGEQIWAVRALTAGNWTVAGYGSLLDGAPV